MAGEAEGECVVCGEVSWYDPTSWGCGWDAENGTYMCGDCMDDLGIDEEDLIE